MKTTCTNCDAYGMVYENIGQQTTVYTTCPKCNGTKKIDTPPNDFAKFICKHFGVDEVIFKITGF